MPANRMDCLVVFGATGDLAKLETFPALVGLVERGVLDVPVIGVSNAGWNLERFREYAVDSLRHNSMDPDTPAARRMIELLGYVDGDLNDHKTYEAVAEAMAAERDRSSGTRDRLRHRVERMLAERYGATAPRPASRRNRWAGARR